jgi:hypothetical protein
VLVIIYSILFKLPIQLSGFLLKFTGFWQLKILQFTSILTLLWLREDGGMCAVPSFMANLGHRSAPRGVTVVCEVI